MPRSYTIDDFAPITVVQPGRLTLLGGKRIPRRTARHQTGTTMADTMLQANLS